MAPVAASNPGGSWGYVVGVAAFMIQFVTFGIAASIGVYNIAFLEHFQSSVAATSMIGAFNIGLLLGGGPLASFLMRKMSYRKVSFLGSLLSSIGLLFCPFAPNIIYLDVFYGVVTGVGFCLVYVPSHTLSGLYFDKHRSLATGIVTSGSGLGGVVFPYVSHFLITEYGWNGSLFIIAAVNMNNFVFSALLLPVPVSKKTKDTAQTDELVVMLTGTTNERTAQISNQNGDAENKSIFETESASNTNENLRTSAEQYQRETTKTNVSLSCNCITAEKEMKNCYVLCNIIFLIYCINNIFWNMGLSMVFVLGPGYFTEFGLSIEESTICLMCFNATITVGGIVGGGVGNLHCINRMVLYIMANFITGVFILMLAMPFVHTFGAICLDMLGMGLVFGIILGLLVVVTVDILGVQSLGDGMGYLLLANGIGNTVGPPIGGWIKDLTGSCMLAFYLAGTVTVVAGGVMLIAPVWECFLSKTKHQVEESRSEE
ncbi:Monocarboxylate transporter 14 [Mizuhopecten yessoensis]|uniref:Monocarboxylate transporter 14 n=1 Tax=Mizuhopecten yessoensis TaxID=6573 RepID=A0A210PHU8_MIZYE|nr:Monocarboxylate transporter 14 [Mizuhopecten yessoensis]